MEFQPREFNIFTSVFTRCFGINLDQILSQIALMESNGLRPKRVVLPKKCKLKIFDLDITFEEVDTPTVE